MIKQKKDLTNYEKDLFSLYLIKYKEDFSWSEVTTENVLKYVFNRDDTICVNFCSDVVYVELRQTANMDIKIFKSLLRKEKLKIMMNK